MEIIMTEKPPTVLTPDLAVAFAKLVRHVSAAHAQLDAGVVDCCRDSLTAAMKCIDETTEFIWVPVEADEEIQ